MSRFAKESIVRSAVSVSLVAVTTFLLVQMQEALSANEHTLHIRPYSVLYLIPIVVITRVWGWRQGAFALGLSMIATATILMRHNYANAGMVERNMVELGALAFVGSLSVWSIDKIQVGASDTRELLNRVEQSREQLATTLHSIGEAVLVTDRAGIITQVNEAAVKLFQMPAGELLDEHADNAFKLFEPQSLTRRPSLVVRVVDQGKTIANAAILETPHGRRVPIEKSAAPIRKRTGEIVGAVIVFRDISQRLEAERKIAETLEHERNVAATLQRSLLLSAPDIAFPGISVHTIYEPASDDLEVGGDFLDAYSLDGAQLAVVVGDVSGKGLTAAAKTAEIKYTLRGYMREYPSPAAAMSKLNQYLIDARRLDGQSLEGFVCVAVAVIDPARHRVVVSAAGSEHPLVARRDGQIETILIQGVPLAIVDKSEYEETVIEFRAGDTIVMVTDGITEARGDGDFFGAAGLQNALAEAMRSTDLAGMPRAILEAARRHAGGPLGDDACILVARLDA